MMNFDENRTFGIEIEFLTTVDRHTVANALNNAGIDAQTESYNHTTKRYWKVITDASCGNELVSPVLKGTEGLNEVKKVCEVLNQLNVKVNKRCGVHVHHGVNDFTIKSFKNLYILYTKYEKAIDSIMPLSRRDNNNYYCKSLIEYSDSYETTVQKIMRCKTARDISYLYGTRYKKLNIQSYVKYGTIEFRQHSGTTDGNKITNWIMLTQAMVTKAISSSVVKKSEKEYNEIGYLLHVLGVLKKNNCSEELYEMGRFFKGRMKELKRNERIAA